MKYVVFFFLLFLLGCGSSDNSGTEVTAKQKVAHYAILGPISSATVTLVDADTNKTIATTATSALTQGAGALQWGSYQVGSFSFAQKLEDATWYKVVVSGGEDVDADDDGVVDAAYSALQGEMYAYCKGSDLQNSQVIVNVFTTIAALQYMHGPLTQSLDKSLSEFAKSVFYKTINNDALVDYKDLFAYIPNYSSNANLTQPQLYANLLANGAMEAILKGGDLYTLLQSDADGDGVIFWDEMLQNSSPIQTDSDGDTLSDLQEMQQGLRADSNDTDNDGLSDADEINIYATSALDSDSDGDYLPDGIEVSNATNPLDADVDVDGVLDGLQGDPFFKYQWYLKSNGDTITNTANVATIAGNDLDILGVYHQTLGDRHGQKSIVQVIDSGVEALHEDLDVNLQLSFNAVTKGNDPTPTQGVSSNPESPLDAGHGTAVAGIIAAKMGNGVGVRGIVPHAQIAGSNWLEDQTLGEIDRVWFSGVDSDAIGVSNNSWGAYVLKDDAYEKILAKATSILRGGKGRIFTFAAGNFRETYGNANLSYLSNNPYAITVASLNHEDKFTSYSNPGSNVIVSAYGGEKYYTGPTIMTTMLSGTSYYQSELNGRKGVITVDEDTQKNYTYAMNGTSSATPMVSGAIALTLDMCPDLSYRDVKWLIAHTASRVDKQNPTWVQNSAGLWHSIDYGYGKINAKKMIELCSSKHFEHLGALETYAVEQHNIDKIIDDTNTTVYQDVYFPKNMKIEWVGLTVDSNHPFCGDLEITLTSPSGTTTSIIKPTELHYDAYRDGFRFGSVAFVDELSQGTWRVAITDRLEGDSGSLNNLKLEVYGREK